MRLIETIKKHGLIEKGDRVGVAVSGGSDSMALLHFLCAKRASLGVNIVAINIDHNIRKNSHLDSKFVSDFCAEKGIEFRGYFVDVPTLRAASRRTIEEEARNARYGVFDQLINDGCIDKLATAHHRSDQAETVLLSLLRGAGAKGVSGMDYARGKLIRPLLDTSKKEIKEYIEQHKIPYVEDPTNEENDYSRNYLRNVILADLETRFSGATDNIVRYAHLAATDQSFINEVADTLTKDLVREGNSVRLPLDLLNNHDAVVSRILFKAFLMLDIFNNIEYVHISDIKKLAKTSQAGKYICLPQGLKVTKDYCSITITKE